MSEGDESDQKPNSLRLQHPSSEFSPLACWGDALSEVNDDWRSPGCWFVNLTKVFLSLWRSAELKCQNEPNSHNKPNQHSASSFQVLLEE